MMEIKLIIIIIITGEIEIPELNNENDNLRRALRSLLVSHACAYQKFVQHDARNFLSSVCAFLCSSCTHNKIVRSHSFARTACSTSIALSLIQAHNVRFNVGAGERKKIYSLSANSCSCFCTVQQLGAVINIIIQPPIMMSHDLSGLIAISSHSIW